MEKLKQPNLNPSQRLLRLSLVGVLACLTAAKSTDASLPTVAQAQQTKEKSNAQLRDTCYQLGIHYEDHAYSLYFGESPDKTKLEKDLKTCPDSPSTAPTADDFLERPKTGNFCFIAGRLSEQAAILMGSIESRRKDGEEVKNSEIRHLYLLDAMHDRYRDKCRRLWR